MVLAQLAEAGFNMKESAAIIELAQKNELSIVGVLKQGLRMYQAVDAGLATFKMVDESPGCGEIE